MLEIGLNPQFAELLKSHGITVTIDEEFIQTDLPGNVKFKTRSVYHEINGGITSEFNLMAVLESGETILEACGDHGVTLEEAIGNNFQNFSLSSLHPMLAALGSIDPHTLDQITIEEWEIGDKLWKAYIGNLVPKFISEEPIRRLPRQFYESFEAGIKSQRLANRFHWFRGYYCQQENNITVREFLMDNELLPDSDEIFKSLPIIPRITFLSCRNFIMLEDNTSNY